MLKEIPILQIEHLIQTLISHEFGLHPSNNILCLYAKSFVQASTVAVY